MKNIIITAIILFFVIICPKVTANPYLKAEITGFPFVTENNVTANINLTYTQNGQSKLYVMSPDTFIVNNDNPDIKIPITNLYILNDGQQYQISNNWQNFYTDISGTAGSIQKNVNLKLENIGELPAGNYTALLKILNKSETSPDYECDFLFTFIIDGKQSILSDSSNPVIQVSENEIFNKQAYIRNQSDVRLDLTSNTGWKLWLNTLNFDDENCEYYLQVKNISGKVSTYEPNSIRLYSNQRYLIASGEPTFEGVQTGNKIPTNITLEYSFKNTSSDNFIKEGIKQNPFIYILERE